MLNVTANHLDRYAGIADYAAAKARIFANAAVQVLNRDDRDRAAMRLPGRTVQTFGAGVPLSEERVGPRRASTRDRGSRAAANCCVPAARSRSSAATTR